MGKEERKVERMKSSMEKAEIITDLKGKSKDEVLYCNFTQVRQM